MAPRPYRAIVFAAYQLSLLTGILLMPLALLARKVGVRVPIDRLVRRLGDAYDRSETESN
jgi:hypothetical protein